MTFRFSTPLVLTLALLSFFASCTGLTTRNHPPLVFALNLSPKTVTLSLEGQSGVLVSFGSVAPWESRPLTKMPPTEAVVLKASLEDSGVFTDWTDPSGTPYSLRFQTGRLYAVVVDPRGQAAVYALPETYSPEPKLCIVNATPAILSQVQVAPDWAKNVKIYTQDVAPVVPSEFYSLEPKVLGLYWQTMEQVPEGGHTAARGPDGKPLRFSFENDRYYLFLAGEGSLRDLTPTLD